MWTNIILGLVRTFGAVFSGFLLARGLDAESAEAIVGAVGALVVAGASAYDKKQIADKVVVAQAASDAAVAQVAAVKFDK